jgi:hypothetical protein
MLDREVDQASGLRRSMSRRRGRVLPIAGAGDDPGVVVRLAQALADVGSEVTVVSDLESVVDGFQRARSRRGLVAMPSWQAGCDLERLPTIAEHCDLTLVAVDDRRLAEGLELRSCGAVVFSGADAESLATAYARIKALVGLGSIREVCTVFDRGSGGAPARRGHARLAQTAARFLGVNLAFGGAVPDTTAPGAYRALAADLAEWARSGDAEVTWRTH